VRAPSDFELTRSNLARKTLLIERITGNEAGKPLLVSTLGGRSWTYALLNRPNEALADADRALAIDPNQPWIIGNKANALLLLNRVDEALALYRTIRDQLGPDDKTPMCSLIREDVTLMRDNDLLPAAIAARVLAEMPCQIRPQ
jgi:predicted Zn-dependent protease